MLQTMVLTMVGKTALDFGSVSDSTTDATMGSPKAYHLRLAYRLGIHAWLAKRLPWAPYLDIDWAC